MTPVIATIIKGSTLLDLVVAAVAAGVGVTFAFSLLIYCAERVIALRRTERRAVARAFQAASLLTVAIVAALVVYGLILMTSKPT